MRSSSLNLLKQAEKNPEKVLKKLNELEEKVKESPKDVISINDPDARLMMNKKGKWEWDYNAQIIVDEYKGIILSSYITQNPTDHFELIPSIEQLKTNFLKEFPVGSFAIPPFFGNKTVGDNQKISDFLIKNTHEGKCNESPSLLFIDPFGYKGIETNVLAQFLKNWGNELFLFINTESF